MRSLPTFRQLVVLLALGCVLPMAGLALGLVGYEYQRQRDQVERDAIGTARALMASVDDRFDSVDRTVQGLANSPALLVGDFGKLYEEAQVFSRTEYVRAVALLDAGGRELLDTRVPFGQPLPGGAALRPLELVQGRSGAVLDLFRSPLTGEYTAGFAVLLPQDRALQVSLDPGWLRDVLARQKLPEGWIAALLDRSGHIVARTHEHERFIGTPARAALVARIAEVPEDAVQSVTVDGVPVVSAFSRSARSGWSIVIGMPREQLIAPLWRSSAVLLLGTAAVLLLTLWLAIRLARSLSASVEALGGAARATGHHARMDLPAPAFQEAHQLGQALLHANAVAEDASEAQKRLEARLHGVLDTAMDGIVTADAHGRIVLFNRAAQAMFRLPQDDAIGMGVEQLVPAPDRARHRQLREQLTPEGARRMAPGRLVRGLRSDGSTFDAQASISVNEEGDERLYTVILRPLAPPQGG
jgi:PAS domain S-box-containing protein